MCYNSSTCDLAEEFSNPMTIEDCCSNGVTFQINETCQQCTGLCYNLIAMHAVYNWTASSVSLSFYLD